jgi:hypothetical protein
MSHLNMPLHDMKIWFGIALSLYVIAAAHPPYGGEAGSFSIKAAVLAALYELNIKFRAAECHQCLTVPLRPGRLVGGRLIKRIARNADRNFSGGNVEITAM